MEPNKELMKLYEEYSSPYQSFEDWYDEWTAVDKKEYDELNRDDEYYSNVD